MGKRDQSRPTYYFEAR